MVWKRKITNLAANYIGKYFSQKNAFPILVYHSIYKDDTKSWGCLEQNFLNQIEFLYKNCYETILISDLVKKWQNRQISNKIIMLTFDDFYTSHIDYCAPILKKYGFKATFFVATDHIKERRYKPEKNIFKNCWEEIGCWDDLSSIKKLGMEVGSHSHSHKRISTLSEKEIDYELYHSKKILEEYLGENIISFAFPYGRCSSFNYYSLKRLPIYGYKIAFTTEWGRINNSCNIFFLPRIYIDYQDDLDSFKNKIVGNYDFLRWVSKIRCIVI